MRQEQIESIIAKRKPMAGRVGAVESRLVNVLGRYGNLRDESRRLLDDPRLAGDFTELTQIFAEADAIAAEANAAAVDLRRIRERLCRDTLNIAVIGRARQGKSRLLQSVTGLSDEEIPSGDGEFCTGVRSDIINKDCETYAVVHFLSEKNLLKLQIKPYFDELREHKTDLIPPQSVVSFRTYALPEPGTISAAPEVRTRLNLALKYLKEYQQHLPEYETLLGREPKTIAREDIREYVAQENKRGERVNFKHLAVERVEIFCRFPNTSAVGLRLIDLPGLGDTRKGDVERVVSALGDQVDLVFFLTKPSNTGAGWTDDQVSLYCEACSALGEKLPIEKWSFWVFNHDSRFGSDNSKQCEILKNSMKAAQINVSESVVVDCAKPHEVADRLIDRALEFLKEHIADNDAEYAEKVQKDVSSFAVRLKDKLERAQGLLSETNAHQKDNRMFDKLFRALWNALQSDLRKLVEKGSKLREQKDKPCEELQRRVETILEREENDTNFPITEERLRKIAGTKESGLSVYDSCLAMLRTRLSALMQEDMDDVINDVLVKMKSSIGAILGATGRLEKRFGPADETLLERLANYIESSPQRDDMELILKGLKLVTDWKMTYRSFIQHRIRASLGYLDPRDKGNEWGSPKDERDALRLLNDMYHLALNEMKKQFADMYKEPNQAAFAVAEEFKDIVVSSFGGIDEENDLEDQWRALYDALSGDVWPDEFGASQATREVRTQLGVPLSSLLNDLRDSNSFSFIS